MRFLQALITAIFAATATSLVAQSTPTPAQALENAFAAMAKDDWGGAMALAAPAGLVAEKCAQKCARDRLRVPGGLTSRH